MNASKKITNDFFKSAPSSKEGEGTHVTSINITKTHKRWLDQYRGNLSAIARSALDKLMEDFPLKGEEK